MNPAKVFEWILLMYSSGPYQQFFVPYQRYCMYYYKLIQVGAQTMWSLTVNKKFS